MDIKRKENETDLQYHKRIIYGKLVDKTLSDIDYSELSELAYGQAYSSDVARRMFYGSKRTLALMDKDGNIVKVGSGFSDEERKLYFEHPELIMSHIVEIKYFEETRSSADNTLSLRFPTWVSNIRDPMDKANPDF